MPEVDEARVEEFMHRMVGYMTGAAVCFGVWLGDELGLYRVLADNGAARPEQIAARANCNPRLVTEWLDGQAAAGLVSYDPATGTYGLTVEAAMALADDN